jgi:hypothetical protein
MTTRLDKTLKRELTLEGRTFILAVSPQGLKLTLKGKRNGQELRWSDVVSGDAALAAALNASLGSFAVADETPARAERVRPAVSTPGSRTPGPPPHKSAGVVRATSKRAPGAPKKRAPRAGKG